MGPLNTNYQAEQAIEEIHHFSHHHPLQLSRHHNQQIPCSACTNPTSTPTYGCQHCNYYLHVSCSRMPQQLQHPFDTNMNHVFKLLPKPVYPDGLFGCDACGHQGSGFSYHCSDCQIDLHVLCAALPSMASVPGHEHQLVRAFRPPYANNKFVCDVCRMPGSKTWLYNCGICQFDVHLGCTRGTQQTKSVMISSRNPQPRPQPQPLRLEHQIFNSVTNGLINGVAEVVTQNAANMVIGAIMGGDLIAGANMDVGAFMSGDQIVGAEAGGYAME